MTRLRAALQYGNYYYALFVFGARQPRLLDAAKARAHHRELLHDDGRDARATRPGSACSRAVSDCGLGRRTSARGLLRPELLAQLCQGQARRHPWGEALGVFRTPPASRFTVAALEFH